LDLSSLDELENKCWRAAFNQPRIIRLRPGAGVVISRDQSMVVMINEEDHLRFAGRAPGLSNSNGVWKQADALDNGLEARLDLAFSPELGY